MDFKEEFDWKEFIIRFVFSAILTWVLTILLLSRYPRSTLLDNLDSKFFIATILSIVIGLLVALKKFNIWRK